MNACLASLIFSSGWNVRFEPPELHFHLGPGHFQDHLGTTRICLICYSVVSYPTDYQNLPCFQIHSRSFWLYLPRLWWGLRFGNPHVGRPYFRILRICCGEFVGCWWRTRQEWIAIAVKWRGKAYQLQSICSGEICISHLWIWWKYPSMWKWSSLGIKQSIIC